MAIQCLMMVVMATIGSCDSRPTHARQQADQRTTTIYLVRHAEKENDGADPDLSAQGQARAKALSTRLKDAGIQRIFATNARRTQQTVAPLAKWLKLKVQVVSADDIDAMVSRISDCTGENILVAAHSNTIGPIIEGLGGDTIDPIDESEFDNLYIVTITPTGDVIIKHEHYGQPSGD
ncbi:MAG: histidine phosphatase family protein [Phycisphaerales bacterium]|jgi:broad specificity phosphatase PhoE|nr:histidine phosphatase family protein [Phycisphaerales bacterium]